MTKEDIKKYEELYLKMRPQVMIDRDDLDGFMEYCEKYRCCWIEFDSGYWRGEKRIWVWVNNSNESLQY